METNPLEPELYRHRAFLLRLAAGLVGSNDAEDLVQEVWTRALGAGGERPAAPRAWLARIARNLAVSRFRRDGRRTAREREHGVRGGPEEAPQDLAETSARFELAQRIATAVQALEEPYRGVVLLRYFEGLEQAAIAERLGVPIATVRTRQQRALARLRERLDRELGGREAWSVALSGWLAPGAPAAVAAATAPAPWLVLGVAGGLVAVGLLAWRELARPVADPGSTAPRVELASPAVPPGRASAPAVAAREAVAPAPLDPLDPSSVQASAIPPQQLVGRIVGLTPAELAQTEVRVHGLHREWAFPQELVALAAPLADGSFRVDLAPLHARAPQLVPQELLLRVDEPRHMPAEQRLPVERGARDEEGNVTHRAEEVRLAPAAVLRGSVVFADGRPGANAIIEAFRLESDRPLPDGRGVTTSDAEGRFELRLAEAAPHALAVLQEGWRPATRITTAVLGREEDLGTLRIERGEALTGTTRVLGVAQASRVVLHTGQPIHHVRRLDGRWGSIGFADGAFEWSNVVLPSDSEGRFTLSGLAPRGYRLYCDIQVGASLGREPRETHVTAPADWIELEFDGARVVLEPSAPVAPGTNCRVQIQRADDDSAIELYLRDDPQTFIAPSDTRLALRVELGDAVQSFELVTPGPGEELRHRITLEPASTVATAQLHLIARSAAGRTLPGLALRLHDVSDRARHPGLRGTSARSLPLVDGAGTLAVAPGDYWVEARVEDLVQRDRSFHVPLEFELSLAAGEEVTRVLDFAAGGFLRVDVRRPEGTRERVQFRLLDAGGAELPVLFEARDPQRGTIQGMWYLEPWGPNELAQALPPGAYTLRLWDDEVPEQLLPFTLAAGETTELAVALPPRE